MRKPSPARYCVARRILTPLALVIAIVMTSTKTSSEEPSVYADFVGSDACAGCHSTEFSAWRESHHGWALRVAAGDNVLGKFDNELVQFDGMTARFFVEGDTYYVETDGPDGQPATYEILYTVGVTPLQQYLVETQGGRLQALDIAWDTIDQRWYHLYPDDIVGADDGLHWTGTYKNWQSRCAVCHQTDFRKNYDPQTLAYQSEWSDLTVGCEACHGPGSAHIVWAENSSDADYASAEDSSSTGGFHDGFENSVDAIEVCATCHSRRAALVPDSPAIGSTFADNYVLSLLRDGLYFADGQINDEVYVYGSFLQSKMFAAGVTCTNCHDPHEAGLVADGNAVCTQCHNPVGREAFPTLVVADYDSPQHHHHMTESEGAQCISCHMPEKTYMIVDPRRDHSFRVPRPDVGEVIGAPDACTSCHSDRTQQWAARQIEEWFPEGKWTQPHYGEVLFAGRTRYDIETTELLLALAVGGEEPAIVRASAVELLSERLDEKVASSLYPLLDDAEPTVRLAVVNALRFAPASLRGEVIAPMMNDPIRSVRLAAALNTIDISTQGLTEGEARLVENARDELRQSISATMETPETQMKIGGIAMTLHNLPAADAAFAEAVRLDPNLIDVWMTRVRIAVAQGDITAVEDVLSSAVAHNPDSPILVQSHGNVLADMGRLDEALAELTAAVSLAPLDPSIRVDLAAVKGGLGDNQGAYAELQNAEILGAHGPIFLEQLALTQSLLGNFQEARDAAVRLTEEFPDYPISPAIEDLLD